MMYSKLSRNPAKILKELRVKRGKSTVHYYGFQLSENCKFENVNRFKSLLFETLEKPHHSLKIGLIINISQDFTRMEKLYLNVCTISSPSDHKWVLK